VVFVNNVKESIFVNIYTAAYRYKKKHLLIYVNQPCHRGSVKELNNVGKATAAAVTPAFRP
jgi:hypothetical protein